MQYIEARPDRAGSLRAAMEKSLWASVRTALAEQGSLPPDGDIPHPANAGPLDFGAYFDLVLMPPDGEGVSPAAKESAARHLTSRLTIGADQNGAASDETCSISNLVEPDYSLDQMARLTRWWDTEPANRMSLTGLSGTEYDVAVRLARKALKMLGMASGALDGEFHALVSQVVLARPDGSQRMDFSGATSFALWGAFVVNVDQHDRWERYYGTMVHEAAHNLLFAIAREQPLVMDNPEDRHSSPLRDDLRPMDGIFHAAFVSVRESMAFDALLCRHEAEPCLVSDEADMIATLLNASVTAFWECEETLRTAARLTPLGNAVLDECREWMQANFLLEQA